LHLKQGSRFVLSGLLGATIEFSILAFLVGHLHITPFVAYLFSSGIPAVFVFFFNRYVTFGSREEVSGQTRRFIMVYGAAFLINYFLSSSLYAFGAHLFLGASVQNIVLTKKEIAYGAKVVAIGLTAIWNYSFSHFYIFRKSHVPMTAEVAGLI
jgi:putative flippase GtrA